jgi:hypothetical protein
MPRARSGYHQSVQDRDADVGHDDEALRSAEFDKVLDRNWNELLQE